MSYIIADTYDKICIIHSTDKEYIKTILTMRTIFVLSYFREIP